MVSAEFHGNQGLMTAAVPGIAARVKVSADDFVVEEIPLYEPSGEGEHLFVWVEKRGLTADELRGIFARALDLAPGDIGMAGQKDKHAVTRQWLSVPRRAEARLASLTEPDIRVLDARPHGNKLRVGHLRGNRFRVVLRPLGGEEHEQFTADEQARAGVIFEEIARRGLANFYGAQRFGAKGDTAEIGLRLLRGDKAGLSRRWLGGAARAFAWSAAQSLVFNHYLYRRLETIGSEGLWPGDVMRKIASGGLFRNVERDPQRAASPGAGDDEGSSPGAGDDEGSSPGAGDDDGGARFRSDHDEVVKERLASREIVATGPIWGAKMFAAEGEALRFETAVLEELGLEPGLFGSLGKKLAGARRDVIVFPEGMRLDARADGIELEFELPSGSYATVLIGEFLKSSVPWT